MKINTIWGDRAHQNSNEHKNKLERNNNLLISDNKNDDTKEDINKKIIKFEIRLADFVVQNHLSFIIGEKILRFIKQYCQDYEIIKMASLNDDKISKLIRECIRPMIITSLNEKIEKVSFSISIDETTHKYSKKKYFSIMVQFYDEHLCNLQSYLHTFKESSEQSDSEALSKILNNQIFDQVIFPVAKLTGQ